MIDFVYDGQYHLEKNPGLDSVCDGQYHLVKNPSLHLLNLLQHLVGP